MRHSSHLEKIIAIERIIQGQPNGITTKQIMQRLQNLYGIETKRQTIYNNIAVLTRFMPINTLKVKNSVFYYIERSDNNAE